MSNSLPLQGDSDKKAGAYAAPLRVEAQDVPNMTVRVRSGGFWNTNNVFIEVIGGTSPTIALPVGNPYWVLVGLSPAGSITLTYGATALAPSIPVLPTTTLPLAAILVTPSTTLITQSMIQDVRFPRAIESIPGLDTLITNFTTFTDLNNGLATKANVSGTPSQVFTLNSGTLIGDIELQANRSTGIPVGIRYNTGLARWEFTNDGLSWGAIATTAGVFANLVSGAVPGHLAGLDVIGNLTDSGFSPSSFQSALGFTPVNKAGDTMTGILTLSGPPVGANDAATKAYVDSRPDQAITLTGDVTGTGVGSITTTLATVNGTVGMYGDASHVATVTANGKGLITALASTPILITESQVTGLTLDLGGKVSKAGDTMTGLLILSGDPVANLGAATKEYVDNKTITLTGDVTGSGSATFGTTLATIVDSGVGAFLRFTRNTKGLVTGTQAVTQSDITTALTYTPVNKAGDTMSGVLDMGTHKIINVVDPTNPQEAATKTYVDTTVSSAVSAAVVSFNTRTGAITLSSSDVTGALTYTPLNKAGDTMTGVLDMGTHLIHNVIDPVVAQDAATKNYVDTGLATKQPLNSNLTALAGTAGTGLYVVTGAGTSTTRTHTSTGATITLTNPDGVAGNINLEVNTNLSITSLTLSGIVPNAFLFSGATGLLTTDAGTNGEILIGSTGSAPVPNTLTAGTGISVINGAGSITIANTGVTAIAGTANQIALSASTGSVTASLPVTVIAPGSLKAAGTGGVGYSTGAGGAVTQLTSRTTGVTLNTPTGAITMFSAAGSTTPATFTVTNSAVAATDVIILNQASGTNLYQLLVTAVGTGSFDITFFTTGGVVVDAPVINFAVIKGVTA